MSSKRRLWRWVFGALLWISFSALLIYVDGRTQSVAHIYYRNSVRRHEAIFARSVAQAEGYFARVLDVVERFGQEPAFAALGSASTDIDATAIRGAVSRLQLALPETAYVRIFDGALSQLLFSSNADDLAARTADRIEIKPIDQIRDANPHLSQLAADRAGGRLLFVADGDSIIYTFSVSVADPSVQDHIFAVYTVVDELENVLRREQSLVAQEQVVILPGRLLLNALQTINYDVAAADLFSSDRIVFDDRFEYLNLRRSAALGSYNYLVSTANISLPPSIRIFSYAAIMISLLLFLLLCGRLAQGRDTIIRGRMRKFRVRLIALARSNNAIDEQRLSAFITAQKSKIYHKVTQGLRQDDSIAAAFAQQWNNLMAALRIAGLISATPPSERQSSASAITRNTAAPEPLAADDGALADDAVVPAAALEPLDNVAMLDDDVIALADAIATAQLTAEQKPFASDIKSVERSQVIATLDDLSVEYDGDHQRTPATQPTGVVFKSEEDIDEFGELFHSHGGVAIDRNPAIPQQLSGLLAHAAHFRYDAVVMRETGIYSVNQSAAAAVQIDNELHELIESIS